jgi:tRNA U38,U39,U40 pseudouridine synthase TruA
MKHLKTFESYELSPTEDPAISSAKVDINNMAQWISEFNSKKSAVDDIYKIYIDSKDLRNKLASKGLIDKDGDGVSFTNPLLASWATASNKKRQVNNIEKAIDLLIGNKSENNQKLAEDQDLKETIDIQNKSIDINIIDKKKRLQELNKEINDAEKETSDKLTEYKTKFKEQSQKLQ